MAKAKPVFGRAKTAESIKSPADGWNAALEDALNHTGWKAWTYKKVKVDFSATVEIVNPGSIVEYVVKLTPGG